MQFLARLDQKSAIYRDWKEHARLGGKIDGVLFKLRDRDFVSGLLTEEQIERIRVRQDKAIKLELCAFVSDELLKIEEILHEEEVEEPVVDIEPIKPLPRRRAKLS